MRHRAKTHGFSRRQGPRVALIRGLVYSLVENGRIKTTLAKAKEIRRHVERAITLSKKNTLHSRRLLLSRYPNENVVEVLSNDLSKRFANRNGGYTRIIKIGRRAGDSARTAFIEFVDYVAGTAGAEASETGKKSSKKAKAGDASEAKTAKKAKAVKKPAAGGKAKKNTRKTQSSARKKTRSK